LRLDVVREVDTRGLHCPGPLLEAIRLIRECLVGETIGVIADDPAAVSSIPAWVKKAGHALTIEQSSRGQRYLLTRTR
jgi:TusA-related sulfurtransferase